MAISYPAILDLKEEGRLINYGDRETMLYALGLGYGADPLDEGELPFVYEKGLRAVPTLATVVAWGTGITTDRLGVDYTLVLHGEEETIFHRPMPPAAELVADSSVVEVYDKGEGKGAIVIRRTILRAVGDGQPIATLNRTTVARGDGGQGGNTGPTPVPHPVPDRDPDSSLEIATRPDQAILYRLSGDRNPLHIEPEYAKRSGFARPILHGLCTYGLTCRAVLRTYCNNEPHRVASHAARFSSPVYPGETLRVDMWRDDDVISFQAVVPERGVTVIKNGKTVLR